MTGRSTAYIAGAAGDEEVVGAADEVEAIIDMVAEDEGAQDANECWRPNSTSQDCSAAKVKNTQH